MHRGCIRQTRGSAPTKGLPRTRRGVPRGGPRPPPPPPVGSRSRPTRCPASYPPLGYSGSPQGTPLRTRASSLYGGPRSPWTPSPPTTGVSALIGADQRRQARCHRGRDRSAERRPPLFRSGRGAVKAMSNRSQPEISPCSTRKARATSAGSCPPPSTWPLSSCMVASSIRPASWFRISPTSGAWSSSSWRTTGAAK